MGGCDKIASKLRSLRKSHTVKKVPVAKPGPHIATSGPRLAILLDDLGSDRDAAQRVFALHYPVTISVLPYHAFSSQIAQEARDRGIGVMLHLPMESIGNETPETLELRPGMNYAEVERMLNGMLENVPTAEGVNNHQGSQATQSAALMAELMPLLKQRDLFFVDSRTTAQTVAYATAYADGVHAAFRNVPFLDDVQDVSAIKKQLDLAIRGAKEKGQAIAIGHPHPETLQALKEMLPEVEREGVHLVFVSDLVK